MARPRPTQPVERVGAAAPGLLDGSTIEVIGSMPLARFVSFPGSPLDHAGYLGLYADWENARAGT